ncbi:MAG: ribonuclease P protein component [Bavariicoccus seileri]|uniref:ribonuclease P protein component n=1 Tax=Bavariicoccus seileri TaxID=549685 RepID=UPI003F97F0AD
MKKRYRVKSERDFKQIFKAGKSYANRQFVVYVLEKKDQQHFRAGISVSKKLGNAVVRNKIKRRIREGFLQLEKQIKPNVDLVIIARQPVVNLPLEMLVKNMTHVLTVAGLLIKSEDSDD